jgi:hypothetical protein
LKRNLFLEVNFTCWPWHFSPTRLLEFPVVFWEMKIKCGGERPRVHGRQGVFFSHLTASRLWPPLIQGHAQAQEFGRSCFVGGEGEAGSEGGREGIDLPQVRAPSFHLFTIHCLPEREKEKSGAQGSKQKIRKKENTTTERASEKEEAFSCQLMPYKQLPNCPLLQSTMRQRISKKKDAPRIYGHYQFLPEKIKFGEKVVAIFDFSNFNEQQFHELLFSGHISRACNKLQAG